MLVHDGRVRLSRGPRENGHRPAIDPLFRSVARWYGPRAIGVILSGSLDDGTAGTSAIKMHGGVTIVQDPKTALYPSMPKSALDNVPIDHVATLSTLGALLTRLVREPAAATQDTMSNDASSSDPELQLETDIAETGVVKEDEPGRPGYRGEPSGFACPDCHGALWELHEGELVRFRCRVGHAFLPQSLSAAMSEQLDEALWIALRSLRENAALCVRLAQRAETRSMRELGASYRERADEAQRRAGLIEQVLRRGQLIVESPELTTTEAQRPDET
jgi:two-component system chemotaxis response regulator CheB